MQRRGAGRMGQLTGPWERMEGPACRTVKTASGRTFVAGLVMVALMRGGSTPAAADPVGTQVFSSLCTAAGGGDISGLRIKVIGIPPDVLVSFEETEGALMVATETKEATYVAATGALAFTVRTETGTISFRGQATPALLTGTLAREGGDPEEVRVPSDRGGDGEGPCSAAGEPIRP